MPLPAPSLGWLRRAARLARSRDVRLDALHEWRRRRNGEPALPDAPVRSVLFLCHGNICRSPFAEALLAARRPDLVVASAGLAAGRDAPADPVAQRVAQRFGVSLGEHRSRPVEAAELLQSDLVFVMQACQAERARRLASDAAAAARIYGLGDFLEARPFALPDPWGRPEAEFVAVFTRIDAAIARVASRLPKASP